MISIAYGDEPYGIEVKKKKIKDMISIPAMNLSFFSGIFDFEVLDACRTFPCFEEKRGVIMEVDSLSYLDTYEFEEYCENPLDSTELLIVVKNVDRRTSIYKSMEMKGLMAPCMRLKNMLDLKKVIAYELKKRNANIKLDAADLFIKKMNYFENEDVDLLQVVGYLDSCACISNVITTEIVNQVCPSFEGANVFLLTSLINAGNAEELYRQISLIPTKDSIGVLSLILKDFRVAYKLKYFSAEAVSTKRTAFSTYSKDLLAECIQIITSIIAGIKNGNCTEDQSLPMACARLLSAIKCCTDRITC